MKSRTCRWAVGMGTTSTFSSADCEKSSQGANDAKIQARARQDEKNAGNGPKLYSGFSDRSLAPCVAQRGMSQNAAERLWGTRSVWPTGAPAGHWLTHQDR